MRLPISPRHPKIPDLMTDSGDAAAASSSPPAPPPFLDVPTLLELSEPRPRANWLWLAAGFFGMLVVGSTMASRQSPQAHQAVERLSLGLMIGLRAVMTLATMHTVRQHRGRQQTVEAIEELIQL